jgi:hypothetical protein
MVRPRLAAAIGLAVLAFGPVSAGHAADPCATDVREAKAALVRAAMGRSDTQAARLSEADGLVRDAETACKQGDMTLASRKAQEALGILKSTPAPGPDGTGVKIGPDARVPEPTRPSDSTTHDPMFIGPTGKTETGEFGASAWVAPSTPVGSEVAGGGRQQSGTPAIGFTFTWGGSSHRAEPAQAP